MSSSSSSSSSLSSRSSSSLTSQLHKRFSSLLLLHDDDDATTEASQLLQDLTEDAYFHFTGFGPARGQLPQFEWSACRKAYTILFWMRPILSEQVIEEGKGGDPAGISTVVERYLYRFFTHSNNVGVVVRCSQWVAKIDDGQESGTSQSPPYVQTTLTACTYDASMQSGAAVTLPLSLRLNQWSLVACSHVFPYLKRPQWTLCVNGSVVGSGDLAYPQTNSLMESNTILQNIVLGGALCPPPTPDSANESTNESTGLTKVLQMDVACCSLYPSVVSPALQAVLTEAGVTFATQSCLAPWLPPIANWTKGSSIEAGPKVGIPLAVHPTAPQLQQLAGTLLMGLSATHAHVLGGGTGSSTILGAGDTDAIAPPLSLPEQPQLQLQQRLVCPMCVSAGATTSDAPRVGLVQPTPPPPIRYHNLYSPNHPASEEAPVLYLTGHVQYVQSPLLVKWRQFLARNKKSNRNPDGGWEAFQEDNDTHRVDPWDHDYRHASLLWEPLPGYIILPFFLSLCPPGVLFESKPHQEYLYDRSIQILHKLYTTPLASQLVQLLTKFLEMGGTRAVEIVLQDGILHSLASNLRLSLLRAQRARLLPPSTSNTSAGSETNTTAPTVAELKRRLQRLDDITSSSTTIPVTTNSSTSGGNSKAAGIVVSPRFIPPSLVKACCDLVAVCCGPPANRMSDPNLYPSDCVKRTSDLALTVIFGLALDLDLWSGHAASLAKVLEVVADRYGGFCITLGYILRSQVSIQYFLDTVRLVQQQHSSSSNNIDSSGASNTGGTSTSSDLAEVGRHQTRLVTAMLMASLSNRRSISQGEHDVASCMNALSDCPLGSLGAHVILNAIVSILVWCDVLPVEAAAPLAMADLSSSSSGHFQPSHDEEHKMQVASRLGRNLLISQFHDVVAPMILSRTVFSAESTTLVSSTASSSSTSTSSSSSDAKKSPLSWESHWRLALLLFSWVASIAGPEGLTAAKSCGSLLLASGLAGSLEGSLDDADKQIVSALYLPPPGMALMIGSMILHDWSYTDLLSDRLAIMMPLLPGLVVSLLSHPSYATSETRISRKSLKVLADLLTAMGGAFHRVFGGTIHLYYQSLTDAAAAAPPKSQVKTRRDKSADSVKAAKSHVPHLLVVSIFLEKHISIRQRRRQAQTDGVTKPPVTIISRPEVSQERLKRIDLDSWVEISTSESVISDVVVTVPPAPENNQDLLGDDFENEIVIPVLHDCEKSVLNTAAGLISNAMSLGGAGAAISIWNHVLTALEDAVAHTMVATDRSTRTTARTTAPQEIASTTLAPPNDESQVTTATTTPSESEDSANATFTNSLDHPDNFLTRDVLCRLISIVLTKALKRHDQWEVWSFEMSSAVAKVCLLVEEKQILDTSAHLSHKGDSGASTISDDQILLLSTMLEVLSYGRDTTGWCQLSLPAMSNSFAEGGRASVDLSAASKLLLPVLEPCFRVVISCVGSIPSRVDIDMVTTHHDGALPSQHTNETETSESTSSNSRRESLLSLVVNELDLTLTAAIVGRAFAAARDMALNAMASLRAAAGRHQEAGDIEATKICQGLILKVAEELRVRYEGERRLRETALFDAYQDDLKDGAVHAVEGANAIERLILGGDMLGSDSQNSNSNQEISFDERRKSLVSDDFVLFHEPEGAAENERSPKVKLGYAHYEGLGAALEECRILAGTAESHDERVGGILGVLGPYLDAWDSVTRSDAELAELVELFGPVLETQLNDSNHLRDTPKIAVIGSEGAADAMSAFFEFAAAEKSRLKEISLRFLPSQRHSRMSFAERFCWARFMEISPALAEILWERGLPDGNRDIRSRIPTVPCTPQFRRFIPKYLDHYSEEAEEELSSESFNPSSSLRSRASLTIGEIDHRRSSVGEIDAFTKSLLQSGNLEIFDITKQEITDDEEPDLPLRPALGSVDEDDPIFNDNVPDVDPSVKKDKKNPTPVDTIHEETADDDGLPEEVPHPGSGPLLNDIVVKGQHSITTSAFSTPPDNASSSLSLMHSAAAGMIELHMDNCLHVKAEGSRHCTMLLTSTHLVLEYEGDPEGFYEGEVLAAQEDADRQRMIKEAGEYKESGPEEVYQQKVDRRQRDVASLRPKSQRWNLSEVSHVYLRRYRLRDSSIEIFFIPSGGTSFGGYGLFSPSSSLFLDFGPGREGCRRRDDAAFAIMYRVPPQAMKQWPDRSVQFLHDQLSRLTVGWVEGRITNFDYLLHLNMLAGRSYNDICQYPVFPWVLADYTSGDIPDLTDRKNFRDLTKPVGALNPNRLEEFLERFKTFADPSIPPFMYGSHYSTSAGVVLHFLVRLHPFAGLHRQLQSGHFDVADRLFSSIPRTWSMCTGTSAAEVKELIPEFYCNPSFLKNTNNFKLGTSQDGDVLGDVVLPPWAKGSPEKFVEVMRAALESEICSEMLPDWIDLIFGRSQQGPEAIKANNVFFYLTYYGSVDVASIEDESLRHATELQIAHFGQCPMQLLRRPHVRRIPRAYHKLSFYQLLSPYSQRLKPYVEETNESTQSWNLIAPQQRSIHGEPYFLPFFSAPLSHWVHLDAPPPGPHAALIAVRFAGADRCLAVDSQGIFHTFRWAWRSQEEQAPDGELERRDFDLGCFVAQRELPRFRSVPRLMHDFLPGQTPAVAISKTLFAGRSVLLVLSDGDGCGGLGMQLVDPSKGQIRGEVMIPAVHAGRITCVATDPIGTAAGHGGVGGELALFGSSDGTASLWRFMSSHYLPLRPRVRLRGQEGSKVSAVALCSGAFVAATLSADRCCLYSIGNGSMIRSFGPPQNTLDFTSAEDTTLTTKFADTPALGVSVQGFVVTVCETLIQSKSAPERKVVMLHLFTIEGVSLGSKPLESWRGLPHKMHCTPDGTAVLVCCGRGITIHRLSACAPLEILDEWQITEADSLGSSVPMDAAFDIDLGPSLNRPVVAAAACSNGVLRLHALPGISAWSERNKKSGITQTVGTALAKPAQKLNRVMREGIGFGRQLAGMGRDIGKEVTSDVKERGVTGFFGNLMRPKGS